MLTYFKMSSKPKQGKAVVLLPGGQEIRYYGNVALVKAINKASELCRQGLRRVKIYIWTNSQVML